MRKLSIKQLEKKIPAVLDEVYKAQEALERASDLMDEITERCELDSVSQLQCDLSDALNNVCEITDYFSIDDVITEYDESQD
jgi:hypothetical protein